MFSKTVHFITRPVNMVCLALVVTSAFFMLFGVLFLMVLSFILLRSFLKLIRAW